MPKKYGSKDYLQVVMLGDSITWSSEVPFGQRYGDFIEAALQARLGSHVVVDVAICGDGGNTTGEGLARLERDCLAYEPHLVLISLGCNNLLNEPEYVEPDLWQIIERIQARWPAARIVLETLAYLDEQKHAWHNKPDVLAAGGLNNLLEERFHIQARCLARAYDLGAYDRGGLFQKALTIHPKLADKMIRDDGVHFTAVGNHYFARGAAALLAKSIRLPLARSKRPAGAWLELACNNPAFHHSCQCLERGGLAQFLRTSGSWSRLMLQQSRSFARRAACMATGRTMHDHALTVAALSAAFSALQRAMQSVKLRQRPETKNWNWLMGQLRPCMQDPLVRQLVHQAQLPDFGVSSYQPVLTSRTDDNKHAPPQLPGISPAGQTYVRKLLNDAEGRVAANHAILQNSGQLATVKAHIRKIKQAIAARDFATAMDLMILRAESPYGRAMKADSFTDFITEGWRMSRLVAKTGAYAAIAKAPYTKANVAGMKFAPLPKSLINAGMINVHSCYGDRDGLVYLVARFHAPLSGAYMIGLGHDCGARLFLDGKPVWCVPKRKNPCVADRSKVPVHLTAGTHEIEIVLDTDKGKGWGMRFRFLAPASQPQIMAAFPAIAPRSVR